MCNQCNEHKDECSCKNTVHHHPIITQHQTDNIFFGDCNVNDKLENLKLSIGTDLTTILKKIDFKFGDNANTVNFSAFNLAYLFSNYTIRNIKQFAEACSIEFGNNKLALNDLLAKHNLQQTTITNNFNKIEDIRKPSILDSSGIGFTVNDDINTVLQKIVDKFNSLNISTSSNNILVSSENSDTINLSFTTTSTERKLKANLKISATSNNAITKLVDGLYVARNTGSTPELYIDGNKIGITGSNFITVPVSGLQNLSLVGNVLTISNSNFVTLPSLTESPLVVNNSGTIRFNQLANNSHNITANVLISANSLNRLSIDSDGLKVVMNAKDVLDQIEGSQILKDQFKTLVGVANSNQCYSWYIKNNGTSSISLNYLDVNNVNQSFNMGANTFLTISGSKILTYPSDTLVITFIGKC